MADPLQHGGFVGQVEATLHEYLGSSDIYSSIFCGAIAGICAKTAIAPAESDEERRRKKKREERRARTEDQGERKEEIV